MRRTAIGSLAFAAMVGTAAAADFSLNFDWGDIPRCTSGQPNVVDNPRFELFDVPDGTGAVVFRMTDLDAPGFDHGGGSVEYQGQATIEPGAFTYKSPCPPNGPHTYRWTASALDRDGGTAIGTATAERTYPD